ncbi:hypothetical protein [Streptomyces sp. 3211]|uniref:hypothetical protein n=1 Tax=Streptomyces sp. 3211 TaxID=1964449 RepID=UPI0018556DD4|nr:hypothetical protein [Streptomyces sp. 3211]
MSSPKEGDDPEWAPQRGDLVKIESTGQLGTLMGLDWGLCQVRPVGGGVEVDVAPDGLVKPTNAERLSAGTRLANQRSWERL